MPTSQELATVAAGAGWAVVRSTEEGNSRLYELTPTGGTDGHSST